ncbi:DUF1801 domain-containing protein [Lacihabitans sp. CS3-21]|jgi:uncharacterized protein YdhG (YjbR/CyaY superfamily)|uniref:DUF1801 domain-containing protein n=1 Tax=Lacihabitans sp. CS3-21 TaxID=2487332 RepID=UPI0020CC6307|nr:DUF1801 domain-containing protein [Lacihabitans sp. CS3-21]MCP9747235.1 DUF1801 domain-containing protein [Lacihabitans sp. CS3-21]
MKNLEKSVDEYVANVSENYHDAIQKLREVVKMNIPKGFVEMLNYGMIGFVVPHELYPNGYHCDPKLPLPFVNIAAQKNFISFYHMGIYAKPSLLEWFVEQYAKTSTQKLDMGKSCIRFKKAEHIPYDLIGELMKKMTVENWIEVYETAFVSNNKK